MFRHAIAACCFTALTSPAIAAPLWQQSESGMSVNEVQNAFPAAKPPPKPSTLHGGAKCELSIEMFPIAADTYRVCFFFLTGKLTQVTLTATDPNRPRFEAIVALLRSKYGPELGAGTNLCKLGTLTVCEADWALKSGTNVGVIFMQVGQNEPIMNVNYQTRIASEASKL